MNQAREQAFYGVELCSESHELSPLGRHVNA
jgi:hypothetical protein